MIRFKRTPSKNHKARIVTEKGPYSKVTYTDRRDDDFGVSISEYFEGAPSLQLKLSDMNRVNLKPAQLRTLRRVINKHFGG